MERQDERRWLPWVAGFVGAAVLLLAAVVGFGQWLARGQDGVLANVILEGAPVGGMERSSLEATVADLADERLGEAIVVRSIREEVAVERARAGLLVDQERTVEAVWSRGRAGLLRPLRDHLGARRGDPIELALVREVDRVALERAAEEVASELSVEPRPAGIEFDASEEPPEGDDRERAIVTEPLEGYDVDAAALTDELRQVLDEAAPASVEAPGTTTAPDAVEADVETVLPAAREAVAGPVVLANPGAGADLELSPEEIALLLEVELDSEAPEGERLTLRAEPALLLEHLGDGGVEELEAPPAEASFVVEGDAVEIVGGEDGFSFDAEATAEELVAVVTSGADRQGQLGGDAAPPAFSRADAEELEITEEVSSFTTEHAPGEPRVHNIQLMADLVDGALIEPGERFSLNDHVGPRTPEAGFVEGGVIVDGEFEDSVGGGVSQFATTFFNAAFFAGIELVDFQPHSYYISRYPEGREATLAYGAIDVVVENSSPHGILVTTSYTSTSITVTFWSSPWVEVDASDSGRQNEQPGEVGDGFDITFRRHLAFPDGREETEEYFHRYEPQDAEASE